jgi:hypothetical protein
MNDQNSKYTETYLLDIKASYTFKSLARTIMQVTKYAVLKCTIMSVLRKPQESEG